MSPFAQLISNGRYRVLVTDAGAGCSMFGEIALTRWGADRTRDAEGPFLYIQDLDRGALWAAGRQPVPGPVGQYHARSGPGRARIQREDDGIVTRLDITVDPDVDAEYRLLTLTNRGRKARRLRVTSYVEVALNHPAADAAHPAFSKLFVQTELVAGGALLARRRPRSPDETPACLAHSLHAGTGAVEGPGGFETDRARFVGRGGTLENPAALSPAGALSGSVGNVLDPVLVIQRDVTLAGGASVQLVAVLSAGQDREAAVRAVGGVTAAHVEARIAAAMSRDQTLLDAHGLPREWRHRLPELTGALAYGQPPEQVGIGLPLASQLVPGDLRALGLARDLPVVVARVRSPNDLPAARELAQVAAYWRAQGLALNLVVLDESRGALAPASMGVSGARGATIVRRTEEVPGQLSDLLLASARLVLAGPPSPAARRHGQSARSAACLPAAGGGPAHEPREALQFDNGFGGFSADGEEYVIRLSRTSDGLRHPPLAWCNVVANEDLGFIATDSGAGYTWSVNSREHRLTPWSNDPIIDPHGEALYLRDEESGEYWSPLPGPVPGAGDYEVRHGFGVTRYLHRSLGLEQHAELFVPRHDAMKVVRLRITNHSRRRRHLTVTSYAGWVLGVLGSETGRLIVTERDQATGAILAMNPHAGEFARRVAFAALLSPEGAVASEWTADRSEFLGTHGSLARPAALAHRTPLDGRAGRGLDPCAAFRQPLRIDPGESLECTVLLGEGEDRDGARAALRRYQSPAAVTGALEGITGFWRDTLGRVTVETPVRELDVLVNGWLAYQNLSCRVWGRSAFYQSGGAYGFRDQLQDAAALVHLDPDLTRRQILLHAGHQFVEGDVLHWWHPPLGKGIRTRFSDDLLWLPFVTAGYVQHTGDTGILEERAGLLSGPELEPGEDETFMLPEDSGTSADLYTHCCLALDRSLTRGAHGLPLMGSGDWNDGMNRVGREGRGESVWLGFFLYDILRRFIPICARRDDAPRVERYRRHLDELGRALNAEGWDGRWYRRAFYDNGAPLGSAANDECRIDAIAQAWAVISGAAPADRAEAALDALEEQLVDEGAGIIRLLTPAFDRTPHDPGYIKGYLPGVRENGGQYTHGALWAVRALAEAGRAERAAHLLEMLSPVSHTRSEEAVATYQAEPYVIAADVYGVAPHLGRGGWTWYTGSAGWMFRVALESVLGLSVEDGSVLRLAPCIPDAWPGFSIRYRLPGEGTVYQISVEQPPRESAEATRVELDGERLEVPEGGVRIPLFRDGAAHRVTVRLGRDLGPRYAPSSAPLDRMTSR